jgi:hypothetical protein
MDDRRNRLQTEERVKKAAGRAVRATLTQWQHVYLVSQCRQTARLSSEQQLAIGTQPKAAGRRYLFPNRPYKNGFNIL